MTVIPEEHLKIYENSFVYKKSRFGNCSPIDLYTKSK
jgi:hypothetical protein